MTLIKNKKGGNPLDVNFLKNQRISFKKLMILAFLTTIFLRNLNINTWCCYLLYDTDEDTKVETSLSYSNP